MARRKASKDAAPDAFQQEGEGWVKWVEDHLALVIGSILLVLGVAVGIEYASSHSARGNSLVTADLKEAVSVYRDATSLQKVLTSTSAVTLNRDFERAAKKLAGVSAAHPGTEAARIATAYEADLLARLEKHADAETKFKSYVDSAQPTDTLLFFAFEGLGYAQEAQEKLDEAAATFDKLATAQPFAKAYALKHKARVLEAKNDTAGAIAAYEAMIGAIEEMIEKKHGSAPPPGIPEASLKRFAETRLKALK